MGVVFTNNAETTLAAAITSTSATSISVTSSSTFPAIQAGEHFYATLDDGTNNEIVKVTGVSGTTWTVVRASDSTTARTFANGITVQLRATAALLTDIQENIAAKSANQTVYNATAASNATAYDVGVNPGVEANAMVFLDGVMQHHDTFSFSGSTLTFDAAPTNGTKIEVIVDNLINLQSSNLTTDTFTATSGQTAFTLSDAPAAENNLIVFIDGVFQDQGNYSISNHTLTLATGAVVGRTVTVYIINPVNIGTPSDGTVTGAKLSGNITMPGTLTVGAFDVAFDSPTFVVDNANSRVGLGTATPSVPVDIVGEVKISSHLTLGTTSKVQFGDSGTYIHQSADGVLDLVSDTEIEINATTIDVNGALDVSGAITGTLATAAQTNITSLGTLTALTGGTGDLNWDSGTLFVDSSANAVGIGTTSPLAQLEIDTAAVDTAIFSIRRQDHATVPLFKIVQDSSVSQGTGHCHITSSNRDMSITAGENLDKTKGLYIKTTGNVGIGTDSPATGLHVVSAAGTTPFRVQGGANSGVNIMEVGYAGGAAGANFIVDDNGRVGIGNSNPTAILTIDNSISTTYSTSGYGGTPANSMLYLNNTHGGSNTASLINFRTGSGDGVIGFVEGGGTNDADFVIQTDGGSNGVERLRITNDGNVGIGVTNPDALLEVAGSARFAQENAAWSFDDSVSGRLGFVKKAGFYPYLVAASGMPLIIGRTDANPITSNVSSQTLTESARFDSSGSFEFNTTANLGARYFIVNQASGSDGGFILRVGNSNKWQNSMNAAGQLQWYSYTAGAITTTMHGNGHVSILGSRVDRGGALNIGGTSSTARVLPQTDNVGYVGEAAFRWQAIYAVAGSINTSDEREKTEIKETTLGLDFIKDLKPVSYKWIDGEQQNKGKDEREHQGLIAQQVAETVEKHGIDKNNFGGLDIQKTEKYDDFHGMSYDQFVAPLIKAIQEQQAQIEALQSEIQELKDNG